MMGEFTLSVSELNGYVQRLLASDPMLQCVRLRGEVSNFKRHSSGHCYFTLKDEGGRVSCVMFRAQAQMQNLRPQDGMRVIATGRVALYPRDGQYQFYVEMLRADGVGALNMEFERLKQALQSEGLFDAARKRPLPLLPTGIGVVTSPTGAVIQDIRQVASRRNPGVALVLYPARVQGEGAAQEIVRGIGVLAAREDVDLIIVGRGGGSLEELWAFNEEIVARAIHACPKPVISAVGHETDFTIADFVADLRAPTPSAAAELAVPSREELLGMLESVHLRLQGAVKGRMQGFQDQMLRLKVRLDSGKPGHRLAQQRERLSGLGRILSMQGPRLVENRRQELARYGEKLQALGPMQVLRRGYVLVTDSRGGPVTQAAQAEIGQKLRLRWSDGAASAVIQGREAHGSEEKAQL